MNGFVTFWKVDKGWGWIYDHTGRNKFFAHISAFKNGLAPQINDKVQFDISATPRGPAAINIEILKEAEVVGSSL
jgi:cold shock CspA family protein